MPTIEIPHLVFARHGDFDNGQSKLNVHGRKQSRELAKRLRQQFGSNVAVLSAKGPRSVETAEIAAKKLGVYTAPLQSFSVSSREQIPERLPQALELLANYPMSHDALCIVMAGEFAKGLFGYVGQQALGVTFESQHLELGEAMVIDIGEKTLTDL